MALYTDTVMDHFLHPRNVGEIADADGVGEVGNAKCGDIMKMYLKINGNVTVTGTLSAGGIEMTTHTHPGDSGGTTGGPQ